MSDNIVSLRGHKMLDGRTPEPRTVALAEKLLELARSGEIIGIAAVVQFTDTAGRMREGAISDTMLGQLTRMEIEIARILERNE